MLFTQIMDLVENHAKTTPRKDVLAAVIDAISLELTVGIVYFDEDHVLSVRSIQPISYSRAKNGTLLVHAHDELRNAPRNFKFEMIADVEFPPAEDK